MKMSIFKPLMAGMVVAMMAGLMSCKKLDEKPFGVSEDFDRHGEVKSSVQNPYDFVGKDFLAYIEFIKENERSIFDPNSPCTINDQPSCATTFDIEDKLVHHAVHFFDSLEYTGVSLQAISDFNSLASTVTLEDLIKSGVISIEESQIMDSLLSFMNQNSDLATLRSEIEWYEREIPHLNLGSEARARLYANFAILDAAFEATISSGGTDLSDVDDILQLHCGWALAGYSAAFVGVCVATGGIGAVAAWVGFGIAIASVFESC